VHPSFSLDAAEDELSLALPAVRETLLAYLFSTEGEETIPGFLTAGRISLPRLRSSTAKRGERGQVPEAAAKLSAEE
jgi:hypothetical protein